LTETIPQDEKRCPVETGRPLKWEDCPKSAEDWERYSPNEPKPSRPSLKHRSSFSVDAVPLVEKNLWPILMHLKPFREIVMVETSFGGLNLR